MKKRKIKKSILTTTLGILIGLLIGSITQEMSVSYILMFIALMVLIVIANTTAITDDFDRKITNAYERGFKNAMTLTPRHHCSCHHHSSEDKESD